MLIKKLLKKYGYPPKGQEDAVKVVMTQYELWTDNVMEDDNMIKFPTNISYDMQQEKKPMMIAENTTKYSEDKE